MASLCELVTLLDFQVTQAIAQQVFPPMASKSVGPSTAGRGHECHYWPKGTLLRSDKQQGFLCMLCVGPDRLDTCFMTW